MYNKKSELKNYFKRVYMLLRGIGRMFFVPVVFVDILLPVMSALSLVHNGISDNAYTDINKLFQMFIPFFSVWWIAFVLRFFIEYDGCEMLFVRKSRNYFPEIAGTAILYIFNISILYLIASAFFGHMIFELVKIIFVCIFCFGVLYFFVRLTFSVNFSLLIVLIYVILNMTVYQMNGKFPLYFNLSPVSESGLISSFILCVIGIMLMILSRLFPRFKAYN